MPRERHPLFEDSAEWEYEIGNTHVGYGFTLHGFRPDTQAAIPLVTCWRPDRETAIQDLRAFALAFDEEAHNDTP